MDDKQFQTFWECFNTLRFLNAKGVVLPCDKENSIRQAILDRYGVDFEDRVMFMGIDIVFV